MRRILRIVNTASESIEVLMQGTRENLQQLVASTASVQDAKPNILIVDAPTKPEVAISVGISRMNKTIPVN